MFLIYITVYKPGDYEVNTFGNSCADDMNCRKCFFYVIGKCVLSHKKRTAKDVHSLFRLSLNHE